MEASGGNGNMANAIIEAVVSVVNLVSTIVAGKSARDVAQAQVKQEELSKLPDWINPRENSPMHIVIIVVLVVLIFILTAGLVYVNKEPN